MGKPSPAPGRTCFSLSGRAKLALGELRSLWQAEKAITNSTFIAGRDVASLSDKKKILRDGPPASVQVLQISVSQHPGHRRADLRGPPRSPSLPLTGRCLKTLYVLTHGLKIFLRTTFGAGLSSLYLVLQHIVDLRLRAVSNSSAVIRQSEAFATSSANRPTALVLGKSGPVAPG